MSISATSAIGFDFADKQDWSIPAEQLLNAFQNGVSCWVDIDLLEERSASALLKSLGVNHVAIEEMLTHRGDGRCDVYPECIHFSVAVPTAGSAAPGVSLVDIVLGERYLITVHHGPADFLKQVRQGYRQDFNTFAQSLGFLLFEFWDHLIAGYRRKARELQDRVEQIQTGIFEREDEGFEDVTSITHDLLVFRKYILAAREVLQTLATRRSAFVPETTQPYLANMLGALDRLASDLTVEREILAETTALYLGVVSHRTSRIINRLTVVSSIFLPLTFLCGVYGMNFAHIPEFEWRYGYLYFWGLTLACATSLLVFMKLKRWL